jgi:hypothetical protein
MLQTGRPGVVLVAYCVLVTGPHGPALCNRGMKALPRVRLQLSEFTSVDERPCQATHFPWLRGKL